MHPTISTAELAHQFRHVLSDDAVLDKEEQLRPYECDALTAYRQLPRLAVLPNTTDEIQAIVKICNKYKIPIVARGAGTSLSGGALPHAEGILLNLAKLNKIIEIDTHNRTATVQPGVRNLAISEAAKPYGLYYAPDPSSQIACTIGGNIAENSGGVHCLKYGLTLHNILALKVLTIDGDILELGGKNLDSSGFDLISLITGSEGMLGITLQATVKLLPHPHDRKVLLAAFDQIQAAGDAVNGIISNGVIPAGLEMLDQLTIQATEMYCSPGYPPNAAAILICELDGYDEELETQIKLVKKILYDHQTIEIRVAKDKQEAELLWLGRKAAFPALGNLTPDYYCMDGTIPRKHLAQVLEDISKLSCKHGLRVANVFHAGDGNLHPVILYDANVSGELEIAEQLGGEILELCVKVGGTITGEHGVGVEKLNQMCVQFSTAELKTFHAIKAVFDENALLNPGKAIPTLHRCAEFGAMHVHHGRLPHPNLPRF
ncbi:MAG: FAD-linked oxidase C-terminal domain-containing protein [Gammaproteobacteria bacterium]